VVQQQAAISPATKQQLHNAWWSGFWGRSHINIQVSTCDIHAG